MVADVDIRGEIRAGEMTEVDSAIRIGKSSGDQNTFEFVQR
jgi:hypothetical protein